MSTEQAVPLRGYVESQFQFTVSRWHRRRFLVELGRRRSQHPEIKIEHREQKHLLDSDFHITVKGTKREPVDVFVGPFCRWTIMQSGMGPMKARGGGFKAVFGGGR